MRWRSRGVTVNGLAIVNEDQGLATWYRDNVIAGAGSFVMTAADYADFSEAIVRKLIKEIEHQERLSSVGYRRKLAHGSILASFARLSTGQSKDLF